MSKRPAEEQLTPDTAKPNPAGNPFAGVSLFSAASGGGLLSTTNPFAGASLFGSSSSPTSLFTSAAAEAKPSASNGFALSADAGKTQVSSSASTASSNPFMGLSLFSPQPAASGGLFSSAASQLSSETPEQGFHLASKEASSVTAESAAEAPRPGGPVKLCLAELIPTRGSQETPPTSQEAPSPVNASQEDAPTAADLAVEQTGEEDEEVTFSADCKLWKLVKTKSPAGTAPVESSDAAGADADGDGDRHEKSKTDGPQDSAQASTSSPEAAEAWRWQDRGCGVIHLNRHRESGRGRLVMRMRGVRKVLLNTPVFPTTKYEKVGQKSVKFMGVDAESPSLESEKFAAYRLNLLSADKQGSFMKVLQDLLQQPAAAGA